MTLAGNTSPDMLPQGSEWNFELLDIYHDAIEKLAKSHQLDTYPNQIEVITAEQMLDAYSSAGMPLGYSHWSYGKQFLDLEKLYKGGHMGLAYEIVINSSPCIAYLMEENSLPTQALVIAHACFGHNSFFKGNYLFREWTDAAAIIDYMLFSKNYIRQCEEKHGQAEVEKLLDSCHALMNYGVDRYKRPSPISMEEERARQTNREDYLQSQVNDLWRTLPKNPNAEQVNQQQRFPSEPQENLLYFIEKHAPLLEPWQREVVRIVRKVSQYFYPQRQTKVMNEGWATFWHYTLLNDLFDQGLVGDGFMLEFLHQHSSVTTQPPFDHPGFSGINPYALGFAMFQDIKRICQHPDDEDRHWFPEIAGSDWHTTLDFAMRNFKDESFIAQYLSPKLIREFRLFSVNDDTQQPTLEIDSIHNEAGYQRIRELLSSQYNLSNQEPNIQVWDVNLKGDRSLTLRHVQHNKKLLNTDVNEVLKHLHRLWGFNVKLESVAEDHRGTQYFQCPAKEASE
ncbi:SpoVR family protein [Pelagibaculum spongiae]|uniref:SpoVR family protein n=1 Tax=Pelagibaculum spongiae TaxID=2080658 RepID=A0A2V1H0N8_9GAMM|nr:SpoVR family protein [Pelagibaculum spongiae]PVZ69572.1 SpoVR family protein [Pelagibaculum spongiae]